MSRLNDILRALGFSVSRVERPPRPFVAAYRRDLEALRRDPGGFDITSWMLYDQGGHPRTFEDYECQFAARKLAQLQPRNLLDVGSYRLFVLGLLANHEVTTLDVRPRVPEHPNETVVTGDAKQLALPDAAFDAVTSLCTIEHFGLGRYGDAFDPDADGKAVAEMARVLKPGGHLIFSSTVTRGRPTIIFNAHRLYTLELLHRLCSGLDCEEQSFYSFRLQRTCSYEEVTGENGKFDIYMGCWRKPGVAK